MPVNSVILFYVHLVVVHDLVMAESARVKGPLAYWVWALKQTTSQVVLAPELAFLKF